MKEISRCFGFGVSGVSQTFLACGGIKPLGSHWSRTPGLHEMKVARPLAPFAPRFCDSAGLGGSAEIKVLLLGFESGCGFAEAEEVIVFLKSVELLRGFRGAGF